MTDYQPIEVIDPREGTLLTLVAYTLRLGKSAEHILKEFKHPFMREVARALIGHKDVSDEAVIEAERIAAWAKLEI